MNPTEEPSMHLTKSDEAELVNLYHLARTALSGTGDEGRHARMVWAAKKFHNSHAVSTATAYKALCRILS